MKKNKTGNIDNKISLPVDILFNIVMIAFCATCVLPMLLMISISLSKEEVIAQYGYTLFPKQISLDAYTSLGENGMEMLKAYGVTIFVTIVGTIITVLITALYAYAISRDSFKYKNLFSFFVFFTMIFNAGLVPWYIVCTKILHLSDSIWALIIPHTMNSFFVFVLRTFFKTTIPSALIEAPKIDGAGEFTIFFKIVLPLSLPGIATIGLFSALGYWNDWWLPLIFISNQDLYNIQYLLYKIITNAQVLLQNAEFIGTSSTIEIPLESMRMALCIIAVAPIIFAYPFFQKYFVQGLTVGAVKG